MFSGLMSRWTMPAVRVCERVRDLAGDPAGVRDGSCTLAGSVPQGLALDIGHDVVKEPSASPESYSGRMWG